MSSSDYEVPGDKCDERCAESCPKRQRTTERAGIVAQLHRAGFGARDDFDLDTPEIVDAVGALVDRQARDHNIFVAKVNALRADLAAMTKQRDDCREQIAVAEQRRMEALADMEMAQNERHAMLIDRDEALGLAACRMRPAMDDRQRDTVVILLDGLEAGLRHTGVELAAVRAIRAALGLGA